MDWTVSLIDTSYITNNSFFVANFAKIQLDSYWNDDVRF